MIHGLIRHWRKIAVASVIPTVPTYDVVSKDTKTAKSANVLNDSVETGWDRMRMMITLDEFGNISSEVNSIYQAGFLGFLVGGIYGGVVQSRGAYLDFMENNQASTFKSHLDAKRKLQDQFTMSFAKGAFRWGWRVALFTCSYVGITTCISVYRGKSSIYEYVSAGTLTGMLYKVNLGLRGMAIGGLLGCVLGGIAGGVSLAVLKVSGTTMEDVRYWQYKWKLDRDTAYEKGLKNIATEPDLESPLAKAHDEKVGESKVSLDDI